ncbi:MAG: TIGR03915 family putative DNA repair protein [Bacteroidota bacterium]|nr:TIGR03915 family putative DNA repair protein [Bacteroidota bacterium]
MASVIYDGSFEGWLTVVFEVYEYKINDAAIATTDHYSPSIFGEVHNTTTDTEKACRVIKGLSHKISPKALDQLYKTFLSEEIGIENTLLRYVQYVFANNRSIEDDYTNFDVLYITQTARKVDREKHRMKAFIRFQKTKDGVYYAICQPDYNVLPIIWTHFKNRYADQRWLIYDSKRKYGIFYDLHKVETVSLLFSPDTCNGKNITSILDDQEQLYQQLWRTYFDSVNISARKNMKLHIQHMPKRYWKYLPEKQRLE